MFVINSHKSHRSIQCCTSFEGEAAFSDVLLAFRKWDTDLQTLISVSSGSVVNYAADPICAFNCRYAEHQGPGVQSIVSLGSSLRGHFVKCFTTLYNQIH